MAATVSAPMTTTSDVRTEHLWTIAETAVAAATEWTLTVPVLGTIVLYQAELVSGTGTTIAPAIGKTASWTTDTVDQVDVVTTPLAVHHITTPVRYHAPEGKLYIRSTPDAGSDNVISTTIGIVTGWTL